MIRLWSTIFGIQWPQPESEFIQQNGKTHVLFVLNLLDVNKVSHFKYSNFFKGRGMVVCKQNIWDLCKNKPF